MEPHVWHENNLRYDEVSSKIPNTWSSIKIDNEDVNVHSNGERYEIDVAFWREIYSQSIRYVDGLLKELMKSVHDRSDRDTIFIVTSDHGENLYGETKMVGHSGSLSHGILNVPYAVLTVPGTQDSTTLNIEMGDQRFFSLLDLGDHVDSISKGQMSFEAQSTPKAELLGNGLDNWNLSETEHAYWNRIQRCVYKSDLKYNWDSMGTSKVQEIFRDEWREKYPDIQDSHIPKQLRDEFSRKITDIEDTLSSRPEEDEYEVPESRLSDLGYL
jgi:membrane-anchored protein YejM (alkaline phosphatase superfamily)